MIEYYRHDDVEPKLPVPTVADELAIFGGSGDLVQAAQAFGESQGYTVYVLKPGDDVLKNLLFATAKRVMAILLPGVYRTLQYHMPPSIPDLWLYGVPGERCPQIRAYRPVGSQYGIGTILGVGKGKRLIMENIEISGFTGNPVSQSPEGTLLQRNVFSHSNGGYALFRGVGWIGSPNLGGTYLIDSEYRDSGSHTVYLDYGGTTVISGSHFSRQQKSSHTIKNISQRTLVEGSTFATGIDGVPGYDESNSWAYIDDNALDPREFSGTACYDGMSGTDFALYRNNRFVMPPSNSPWISLQTREAANGNMPAYPAPGIGIKALAKAHADAAKPYIDEAEPSAMWEDLWWDSFEPARHYFDGNEFVLTGSQADAKRMIGCTIAHNHPATWSPTGGMLIPVDDEWQHWLAEKLNKRVTVEIGYRNNVFPADLKQAFDWRAGGVPTYAALPHEGNVIMPMLTGVDPLAVEPMLRRWTGVDFVRATAGQQPEPAEPAPLPTEPEPTPEPPVVVTPPPVEEPPVVEPTPPSNTPYWETVAVTHEFSSATDHYREVLQKMKRVTY